MDFMREVRHLRRTVLQAPAMELPPVAELIPHRPPFLLVSELCGYDAKAGVLTGVLRVRGDDPIVQAHFPGNPVYPGTLQQEAVAQLGACLLRLMSPALDASSTPLLTRVHHAVYARPIPVSLTDGADVSLGAQILSNDGILSIFIGQVVFSAAVCAVMVMEAMYAR